MKGLGKDTVDARQKENDEAAARFISGAPLASTRAETAVVIPAVATKKKAKAGSKRFNFSLEDKVDKSIDKLSLLPRSFKASRSDVVRAGVAALQAMPRAQAVELLRSVVGAEADEDDTQGE